MRNSCTLAEKGLIMMLAGLSATLALASGHDNEASLNAVFASSEFKELAKEDRLGALAIRAMTEAEKKAFLKLRLDHPLIEEEDWIVLVRREEETILAISARLAPLERLLESASFNLRKSAGAN